MTGPLDRPAAWNTLDNRAGLYDCIRHSYKSRYEVEGDLDLHRFLGLGGPRAGFSAIRAKSWVRSPNATTEQLEELCQYVQDTSPVRDILVGAVPVTTDLVVLD